MFALLQPTCTRALARPALSTLRRSLATPPPPPPSPEAANAAGEKQRASPPSWPLWASLTGLGGLAYWVYLQQTGQLAYDPTKSFKEATKEQPAKTLTSALNKDEFRTFELLRKEEYNHNTNRYLFKLPEGTATLLPVASCVLLKAGEEGEGPKDDKGRPVARPYTPISESEREGEVEFLIKKYDTGKFTPYLASLSPGSKISIKGPLSKFPYQPNQFTHCGLLAGGSGITPMYQLLQHSLSIPEDKTKFTLIFANVSSMDILLKEEFDDLASAHPDRLEVLYVLDKAEKSWKGPTGYITKDLLKKHIAGPEGGEKVKVFVCGPPGQVQALAGKKDGMKQGVLGGVLKELGYTEDQVFKF